VYGKPPYNKVAGAGELRCRMARLSRSRASASPCAVREHRERFLANRGLIARCSVGRRLAALWCRTAASWHASCTAAVAVESRPADRRHSRRPTPSTLHVVGASPGAGRKLDGKIDS